MAASNDPPLTSSASLAICSGYPISMICPIFGSVVEVVVVEELLDAGYQSKNHALIRKSYRGLCNRAK